MEVLADDFPLESVGLGIVNADGDAVAVGLERAQDVLPLPATSITKQNFILPQNIKVKMMEKEEFPNLH